MKFNWNRHFIVVYKRHLVTIRIVAKTRLWPKFEVTVFFDVSFHECQKVESSINEMIHLKKSVTQFFAKSANFA